MVFFGFSLFYIFMAMDSVLLTNNIERSIGYLGIALALMAIFISMGFAEDVIKLNDGLKNKVDKMNKKLDELVGKSKRK